MDAKWGLGQRRPKGERDKYLTPEELGRLFEASKTVGGFWYPFFVVQASLGLRVSEARTLTRDAFRSLHEGIVLIRTLKQKGTATEDIVSIDDKTKEFIGRYLKSLPAAQQLLFPFRGKPISRVAAWIAFAKACELAGLPKAYSPHALRHSRGIALWEGTKDLQFVRAQLRHRSVSSTSIYMHMSQKTQMELTKKVKPMF